MITKKYGIDFTSYGGALTLSPSEVSAIDGYVGQSSRTHADGWTIEGEVCEDWLYWVNNFDANHPEYGRVHGNFEHEVYADSEEGFAHFFANHPPQEWDYWDI